MLPSKDTLTRTSLRTPKAAAIAGIIFSILLTLIVLLLRLSVPTDPLEPGAWLETNSRTVALAMNLVPFDGVAFLWFIGVLRDRLGQREDLWPRDEAAPLANRDSHSLRSFERRKRSNAVRVTMAVVQVLICPSVHPSLESRRPGQGRVLQDN